MNGMLKKIAEKKGIPPEDLEIMESLAEKGSEGIVDLEELSGLSVIGGNDLPEFISRELNAQLRTMRDLLEKAGHEIEIEIISREDVAYAFGNAPWTEAMNVIGETFTSQQKEMYRLIGNEMGLSEEDIEEVLGPTET